MRRVCSGPMTQNWMTARKSFAARSRPVDEADGLGLAPPSSPRERDLRAVAQQLPDRLVRADAIHRRAVEDELLDGRVERLRRKLGVELASFGRSRWRRITSERSSRPGCPLGPAIRPELLRVCVDDS